MKNLASLYLNGVLGLENKGEGVEWYKKAALSGDHTAMLDIGVIYENGIVGMTDYAESLRSRASPP